MPKTKKFLKEVFISSEGRFVDENKNVIKYEILRIDVAKPNGEPFFQSRELPKDANAYARGKPFDANSGPCCALPMCATPVVYLRIS